MSADYPTNYDFDEGFDPTNLSQVSASQLLQMIREATPMDKRGVIIYNDDTPNVNDFPRLKRFIWIRPSQPQILRTWNEDSETWEFVQPAIGSVLGKHIAPQAIDLSHLNPDGASPLFIIRVNNDGDGFEFVDLEDIITVSPSSITPGSALQLLRTATDGSTVEWFSPGSSFIVNLINTGAIPIQKLVAGPNSTLVLTDPNGNVVWDSIENIIRFLLPSNSLSPTKIEPGSQDHVLATDSNSAVWRSISEIRKLVLSYQYFSTIFTARDETVDLGNFQAGEFIEESIVDISGAPEAIPNANFALVVFTVDRLSSGDEAWFDFLAATDANDRFVIHWRNQQHSSEREFRSEVILIPLLDGKFHLKVRQNNGSGTTRYRVIIEGIIP